MTIENDIMTTPGQSLCFFDSNYQPIRLNFDPFPSMVTFGMICNNDLLMPLLAGAIYNHSWGTIINFDDWKTLMDGVEKALEQEDQPTQDIIRQSYLEPIKTHLPNIAPQMQIICWVHRGYHQQGENLVTTKCDCDLCKSAYTFKNFHPNEPVIPSDIGDCDAEIFAEIASLRLVTEGN